MNTNKEYRETAQRQVILDILCSTKSHPTVDWIYEKAKKDFPKLSLGTVYRNLKILKEQGKIQELPFGDTYDHFDGNALPHPHFVCKKCGSVVDLRMAQPDSLMKIAEDKSGFDIESYSMTFYGLCDKCK
ncbi:MAG: transcriptional repressor [Deltaproteobacteria bacterium CG11_big_fil_rev_8_21_14_0_20_49_13]|nr:MAG: transcriptional repressor [Deltaproteobacteria bacterium CG11_big_fil_rev_8_21_14_0_20_49_13]